MKRNQGYIARTSIVTATQYAAFRALVLENPTGNLGTALAEKLNISSSESQGIIQHIEENKPKDSEVTCCSVDLLYKLRLLPTHMRDAFSIRVFPSIHQMLENRDQQIDNSSDLYVVVDCMRNKGMRVNMTEFVKARGVVEGDMDQLWKTLNDLGVKMFDKSDVIRRPGSSSRKTASPQVKREIGGLFILAAQALNEAGRSWEDTARLIQPEGYSYIINHAFESMTTAQYEAVTSAFNIDGEDMPSDHGTISLKDYNAVITELGKRGVRKPDARKVLRGPAILDLI